MKILNVTTSNIPLPKPGCPLGEDMVLIKKNIYGVIDGVSGSSMREGDPSNWYQCRDYIKTFIQVLNTFDPLNVAVNKGIVYGILRFVWDVYVRNDKSKRR